MVGGSKLPKLKTHKCTQKRFKVTGSGRIMRVKIGKSHLRRRKPKRVKALFDTYIEVTHRGNKRRIRKLAPTLR